jgi:hypothetical protein
MDLKKFIGPVILAGIAILLLVGVNVFSDMKYDEGDTVDPGDVQTSCCTGLLSILSCLGSIVWFAFALGYRKEKTVFLVGNPALPGAVDSTPPGVIREFTVETSRGDGARAIGFFLLGGSLFAIVLMVLLGIVSIISSMGSGLGGSGGSCDEFCEGTWVAAGVSGWGALIFFISGLISLARPWSWFTQGGGVLVPTQGPTVEVEESGFKSSTVRELKEKLREVGLAVSGNKSELISRLENAQKKETGENITTGCSNCKTNLRFPSDYSGRIRCPKCDTVHKI